MLRKSGFVTLYLEIILILSYSKIYDFENSNVLPRINFN